MPVDGSETAAVIAGYTAVGTAVDTAADTAAGIAAGTVADNGDNGCSATWKVGDLDLLTCLDLSGGQRRTAGTEQAPYGEG